MAFRGDTRSLALSDVFQNLLQNKQTGTLTVTPEGEHPIRVWFKQVSVQHFPPGVPSHEYLPLLLKQRAGATDDEIARGLKKGGKQRGLTAVLTKMGAVTEERVVEALRFFSEERIYDLFALDDATFEFAEGDADPAQFDADQTAVALALDTNKVLFEAARRSDEWGLIRKKILSRGESFAVPRERREAAAALEDRTLRRIAELCDGSRTVAQVIDDSAEGAFTVCKAITDLLGKGLLKPVATDELDRLAEQARTQGDWKACIEYCRQALERERNRPATRERLAGALEATGDREGAATEWKLLAAAQLEAGRTDAAIAAWRHAAACLPRDTAVREQLLRALIEHGGGDAAIQEGRDLALTYRELGMPEKVRDTYRRLLDLSAADPQLPRLLADAHVELGDKAGAQAVLWEHAGELARTEREADAVPLLQALLKLAPSHAEAKRLLADIESGNLAKRLARERRRRRLLVTAGGLLLLVGYGGYDTAARFACDAAAADALALYAVDHDRAKAVARCEAAAARWPMTRGASLLRAQAGTLKGAPTVEQHLGNALANGRLGEAERIVTEARDALLGPVRANEARLVEHLTARFKAILAPRADGSRVDGDALALALVAEADVLAAWRPAYRALVELFTTEVAPTDAPDALPDPGDAARWRGVTDALVVLRHLVGPQVRSLTNGSLRFEPPRGAEVAAYVRAFKQRWDDERKALGAAK